MLEDKKPRHQKSRFFIASKGAGLSLDIGPSRIALKCLLQNIYSVLDLLYHERNLFFYDCCRWQHFKNIFKKVLLLPSCYNDEIVSNTKTHFHMEEKLLQLFCIKDYSVKFFAKFRDFYTTEQSNFLMLHNFMKYFSDTRVNQIVNV